MDCVLYFCIVRDIATAIKDLLDAVNEVFKNCQSVGKMAQYKEVNYVYMLQLVYCSGEGSGKEGSKLTASLKDCVSLFLQ